MQNNNEQIQDPRTNGVAGLSGLPSVEQQEKENQAKINPVLELQEWYKANSQQITQEYLDNALNQNNYTDPYQSLQVPEEFGKSIYDKKIKNPWQLEDLNEVRAQNQSGIAQIGAGVAKFATTTGITFVQNTLGLVYGVAAAINETAKGIANDEYSFSASFNKLFNNDFSNALQTLSDKIEEEIPNYKTFEQQHSAWYDPVNLISTNGVAELIKMTGFTVGSMMGANAFTGILRGAGLMTNAVTARLVGSVISGIGEATVETVRNTSDANKLFGEQMYDQAIRAANGLDIDLSQYGVAKDASGNYDKDSFDKFMNQLTPENVTNWVNTQQAEIDKLTYGSGEDGSPVSGINRALAQDRQKKLDKKRAFLEKLLQEKTRVQQQLIEHGNKLALANIAIVGASDYFALGRYYTRGFSNARRAETVARRAGKTANTTAAKEAETAMAAAEAEVRASRNAEGKLVGDFITKKKAIGKALAKSAAEANEEMMQSMAAETSTNQVFSDDPDAYYKMLTNPDYKIDTANFIDALGKGFDDTYLNADAWNEAFSAFITTLVGMPTFGKVSNARADTYLGRGKFVGMTGGLFGELSNARDVNERIENAVNQINTFEQKLGDGASYVNMMNAMQDAMDGYVAEDDEFNFQNSADNQLFGIIGAYNRLGRMTDLKDLVNQDFENFSQEDLMQIAKLLNNNEDNVTGYLNPDGSPMPTTEEGRKKMIDILNQRKEDFIKQIDNYEKAIEWARGIHSDAQQKSENETAELAWLKWKVNRFDDRFKSLLDKHKGNIQTIQNLLTEYTYPEGSHFDSIDISTEDGKALFNIIKNFQTYLAQLNNPKITSLGFGLFINQNKQAVKALQTMLNSSLATDEEGKTIATIFDIIGSELKMTVDEVNKIFDDFSDMNKMVSAQKSFKERLEEFVKDPLAQQKNRNKIDQQQREEQQQKNVDDLLDQLDNAETETQRNKVFNDFMDYFDSLTDEERDEELNHINDIDPDKADQINQFEANRDDALARRQNVYNLIYNDTELDQQTKNDAIDLLNMPFDNFLTVDAITNTSRSDWEDNQKNSNNLPEELHNNPARLLKAKNAIQQANDILDNVSPSNADGEQGTANTESSEEELNNNAAQSGDNVTNVESVANTEGTSTTTSTKKVRSIPVEQYQENEDNSKDAKDQTTQYINRQNDTDSSGIITGNSYFWKPNQTQYRIGTPITENSIPFHRETNNSYSKEYQQQIKAIGKYLEEKGAFQAVRTNTIGTNSVLHFRIDTDLNNNAGTTVILLIDENGNVVGNLATALDLQYNKRNVPQNLSQFIKYLETRLAEEQAKDNTKTVFDFKDKTIHIGKWMSGRPMYTTQYKSVSEWEKDSNPIDLHLAVATDEKGSLSTTKGGKVDTSIIQPLSSKEGQVFVLVSTGAKEGTARSRIALPCSIGKYQVGISTEIDNAVKEALKKLKNTVNEASPLQTDIVKTLNELNALLCGEFHTEKNNDKVLRFYRNTKQADGKIVKGQEFTVDINTLFNPDGTINETEFADFFNKIDTYPNVKLSELYKTSYVNSLKPFIRTNYNPGQATYDNWFTTTYMVKDKLGNWVESKWEETSTVPTTGTNINSKTKAAQTQNTTNTITSNEEKPAPSNTKPVANEIYPGITLSPGITQKPVIGTIQDILHQLFDKFYREGKTVEDLIQYFVNSKFYYSTVTDSKGIAHEEILFIPNYISSNDAINTINFSTAFLFRKDKTAESNEQIVVISGAQSLSDDVLSNRLYTQDYDNFVQETSIILFFQKSFSDIVKEYATYVKSKTTSTTTTETTADTTTEESESMSSSERNQMSQDIANGEVERVGIHFNFGNTNEKTEEDVLNEFEQKYPDAKSVPTNLASTFDIWRKLNKEQKLEYVKYCNNDLSKMNAKWKKSMSNWKKNNTFTSKELTRETSNTDKMISQEKFIKERKWLDKVLPQLSKEDRVQIVNSLIKISNSENPSRAWGTYKDGVITLVNRASSGTTYHEAFHMVSNAILSSKEQRSLYDEAQQLFKTTTDLETEERLAEEFRKYMLLEQTPFVGNIVKFFRTLKHYIQNIIGNELQMNAIFYNISRGNYADRTINTDLNINEVKDYYIQKFDFDNLTEEQKQALNEVSISQEDYNKLTTQEKELFFKCHY